MPTLLRPGQLVARPSNSRCVEQPEYDHIAQVRRWGEPANDRVLMTKNSQDKEPNPGGDPPPPPQMTGNSGDKEPNPSPGGDPPPPQS